MRELVADFYNCCYARCLRSLDAMIPMLMLDMHLAEHVKDLHGQVRPLHHICVCNFQSLCLPSLPCHTHMWQTL